MASSNFTTTLVGKDKTAAAFNSVANRAKATGESIRSALKGAFALAGTYIGIRQAVRTINELGSLSDVAMRAKVSVDELTRSATAFGVIGLKGLDVSGLNQLFAIMQKNNGRRGFEGFYQTIQELQQIPDAAERGKEAVKVFGRSGVNLLPLINSGEEATEAIKTIAAAMPSIPQSAADAGDAAADAMTILGDEVKSIWAQSISFIVSSFDDQFAGGVREAALSLGNWLNMWAKRAANFTAHTFQESGKRIGGFLAATTEAVSTLWDTGSLDKAGEAWDRTMDIMHADLEKDSKAFMETDRQYVEAYEKRKEAIAEFGKAYIKTQKAISEGMFDKFKVEETNAAESGSAAAAKLAQVRNSLIQAGSNEALRLAANGPQVSEAKKQTTLLKTIADNTKKTAEATQETAEASSETSETFSTI